MIKPFYQGKVDTFCAIYAVLNALRMTHAIRTLKARALFNDALLDLALDVAAFRDVLEQRTDYMALVDGMLEKVRRELSLDVIIPYGPGSRPDADTLWEACRRWMDGGDKRTVIFRFMRFLQPEADPFVRHWTTIDRIDAATLHLFDCSHEAEAILNMRRGAFVTRREDVSKEKLLWVQPESLRFVRLPC